MQVWSPPPSPRSPARTRASTPHTTPPAGGSAPTLRPRMLPAARRPGLNDALNAAMSLHNTRLCATQNCSTLHTHAHTMRDTHEARARAAASPLAERARLARQRARACHKVCDKRGADLRIGHEVGNTSFPFLWLRNVHAICGYAHRPGTHNSTTLPAPADDADGTRAGGIPRQRTASAPMPTAATGTTLRSLTPSWAAGAVWSAARRMPSWAFN